MRALYAVVVSVMLVAGVCLAVGTVAVTPASASGSQSIAIGTVNGTFYPNPNNSGPFDNSQLSNPQLTSSFPEIDFNAPSSAQVSCSSPTGINESTRPFTDVVEWPGGSCNTQPAVSGSLQAGVGNLYMFEAVFLSDLTVAQPGQVTFNFYSDDGWILGMGKQENGTAQPTYVSGELYNAPASTPSKGYPVDGSYNTNSSPTQNQVTVNFPAAGTYPVEVDYTECCGGSLALTLGTTLGNPILPASQSSSGFGQGNPSSNKVSPCSGDPVNCATGNFWETYSDLAIPGRGPALNLSRTYNSLGAETLGRFGYGWSDSYGMSLQSDPATGDETVVQENGSTVTFYPSGSGFASSPDVLATLVHNGDGTWTFARRAAQIFTFSSTGQLTAEKDLNGYTTTLAYNGSGQISSVTDPAGRAVTFAYGSNGLVSSATDPSGRTVSYGYDANNNLTCVTDPAGRVTTFAYDANHELTTLTDPRSGVLTNTYDSFGRVTAQRDPAGRNTAWSYAATSTTITEPTGSTTVENLSNGEMTSRTIASGTPAAETWNYTYDPVTLGLASVTDPNGHIWSYTYDASGNLIKRVDPLERTTTSTFNSFDEPLSVTDPGGVVTTFTYDAQGNLLTRTVTGVGGTPVETTTFTYGDSSHPGDVTQVSDPAGHLTNYIYDANGDVISSTTHPASGVNDTTLATYDAIGRVVCTAAPNAVAAGVTCPAASQPRVTDTTTYAYDADSEVTSVTDPPWATSLRAPTTGTAT